MATKYQKQFELGLTDIEMIENALRDQARQLCQERLGKHEAQEQDAANDDDPRDSQMMAIQSVLGKLHNQKIWYSPEKYVPRG